MMHIPSFRNDTRERTTITKLDNDPEIVVVIEPIDKVCNVIVSNKVGATSQARNKYVWHAHLQDVRISTSVAKSCNWPGEEMGAIFDAADCPVRRFRTRWTLP